MAWHGLSEKSYATPAPPQKVYVMSRHVMPCQTFINTNQTNKNKIMQATEYTQTSVEVESKNPRLILFKVVIVCSITMLLSGIIIHLIQSRSSVAKAPPIEQPRRGDGRRELTKPETAPSEPPVIITKKPEKPIIIEEGSEAWFCLKNDGGSSCLGRDRFVPNYQVVAPPTPQQKSYEDYLVEYGIRNGGQCGRWLNGKPHCTGIFY